MTDPTVDEYTETLRALLQDPVEPLSAEESVDLRAIVRERRSGRRSQTTASAAVHERADEIVEMLGRAARHLRPRETQQLDDFVAGKEPEPALVVRHPVRPHRNGRHVR